MAEPIIAIIFDCDGTLAPDTISYMLEAYGIDPTEFWEEIETFVKKGWDPPQAYMHRILQYVVDNEMPDLTRKRLRDLGKEAELFPGLPGMFPELKQYVSDNPDLKKAHVSLEFYIISGGLEEMIRGTELAEHMDGIFGCNFDHDPASDLPVAVKSTVSFTEKTRFIFAVNKDISPEEAGQPFVSGQHCYERLHFGGLELFGKIIRSKGGDISLDREKERVSAPNH